MIDLLVFTEHSKHFIEIPKNYVVGVLHPRRTCGDSAGSESFHIDVAVQQQSLYQFHNES